MKTPHARLKNGSLHTQVMFDASTEQKSFWVWLLRPWWGWGGEIWITEPGESPLHCFNILSHCSSWSNASSCGGGVVCPCPTTAGWPLSHAGGGGSRQVDILLAPSYRYTTTPRSARWSFLLMRADGSWPLFTLVIHAGNCDYSTTLHNSRHK